MLTSSSKCSTRLPLQLPLPSETLNPANPLRMPRQYSLPWKITFARRHVTLLGRYASPAFSGSFLSAGIVLKRNVFFPRQLSCRNPRWLAPRCSVVVIPSRGSNKLVAFLSRGRTHWLHHFLSGIPTQLARPDAKTNTSGRRGGEVESHSEGGMG
jgi:hypothetical protein